MDMDKTKLTEGLVFRKASQSDMDQLARIRMKQLRDEGQTEDTDIHGEIVRYLSDKMTSGELIEWVAEDLNGEIAATAAIVFMELPPSFNNTLGIKGYITNMYTKDEYRGRGLAGLLMEKLEQEALDRGITKLFLHASVMGRRAYAKVGYAETDLLMEKTLDSIE